MTTDQNGNTLKYDAWNRLISVTNSSGQVLAEYTYNALSQRVTETYPVAAPGIPADTVKNPGAAAQPRHPASAGFRGIDKSPAQSAAGAAPLNLYYSTGGQILEERWDGTAASNTQYQYVWSATYVNAMVLRDTFTAGAIQPDLRIYTTNDANYNPDSLLLAASGFRPPWLNVTALVTYNAATRTWGVSERFVYSPYGSVEFLDASFTSIPDAFNWQYMYQGGRFDTATGLYHFGARNYSPSLGVWVSQDPAQYINGADAYQFVESSPVARTDPKGLWWGAFISAFYWQAGQALYGAGQSVAAAVAHPGNTYDSAVNATSSVMYQDMQMGGSTTDAALTGLAYEFDSAIGTAQVMQGFAGINIANDQYLTGMQQAQYIVGGLGQMGLTAAALGETVNPALPNAYSFQLAPRLGDLTPAEIAAIQAAVDKVGLPLKVVGSAARGARGPCSDIDYAALPDDLPAWDPYGPQLPGIDLSHGILPPYGPTGGIQFRPNVPPRLIK